MDVLNSVCRGLDDVDAMEENNWMHEKSLYEWERWMCKQDKAQLGVQVLYDSIIRVAFILAPCVTSWTYPTSNLR